MTPLIGEFIDEEVPTRYMSFVSCHRLVVLARLDRRQRNGAGPRRDCREPFGPNGDTHP